MHRTSCPIKPNLFILLCLVTFASVNALLFVAALPHIAAFFKIPPNMSQRLITVYLIGYALGVLPFGPLANRMGRKKALILGSFIAITGSFLCLIAAKLHSFEMLIWGRFIVAFGASAGFKITFTMIADIYDHKQLSKATSYISIAFAVIPAFGILIGGLLTHYLDWKSCFDFLMIYSIFICVLSFYLPETCEKIDPEALKIKKFTEGLFRKAKDSNVVLAGLIRGCGSAITYLFAAEAPFIANRSLGLSAEQFGIYNLIPTAGLVIGSLAALKYSSRENTFEMIKKGNNLMLIAAGAMLAAFLLGWIGPTSVFILTAILYIGYSLNYVNISSISLSVAQDKSNTSAVISFINLSCATLAVSFLEIFAAADSYTLPFFFLLFGTICTLLTIKLEKQVL